MVCRQLGRKLHELHPVLPLYDGVTGQAVPQHMDNRVERLRDALMDDARERVDDLGEDLVVGAPSLEACLFALMPVCFHAFCIHACPLLCLSALMPVCIVQFLFAFFPVCFDVCLP